MPSVNELSAYVDAGGPMSEPTMLIKTAKQIGVTIPQSVQYRANKVIK
jgi:hypothetical protein